MKANNRKIQQCPQNAVLVSVEDDCVLIENPLQLDITHDNLITISTRILSWFESGKYAKDEHSSAFVKEVIGDIPIEGGAIPIDNISDWIALRRHQDDMLTVQPQCVIEHSSVILYT